MPNYKTHITWSSIAGVGLGLTARVFYNVSISQAVLGGVLCSLGGVLPDVDSDTSTSYQRCISTIAGVSVLLLASRLSDFALESESVVTTCAAVYFIIVYVVGGIVKKLTRHRGMCHSIPFAVIAGELIFILSSGTTQLRLFKAASIFFGVLIHLFLDELNSFSVSGTASGSRNRDYYQSNSYMSNGYGNTYNNRGKKSKKRKNLVIPAVRVKNSFGTALKLIDYKHLGTTIIFYVVAAFLGHCAMGVQDFLARMGDVDQAEIQGTAAVERVKRIYPKQFDLAVVQWVAENKLTLSPGQDDNKKWHELEQMLAIGEDAVKEKKKEESRSSFLRQHSPSDESYDNNDEEIVSLLDVINWNSLNQSESNSTNSYNEGERR